jgi:hypothetical protein
VLPIATFLAGALLSLLLPTIMLTALVVWYLLFIRRVPETGDENEPLTPEPNPGAPHEADGSPGAAP